MKYIISVSLLLALYGCFGRKPKKTGMEGKSLPSFSLLLPDSITYLNTSNIKEGTPTVLFLFGPNCPYSKAQMKEIIEDMDGLKNINFYLITNYPFHDMKRFYYEYNLSKYSNITIGRDTAYFFTDYLKIPGVPYMAIYGKDKKLIKTFTGKIYSNQIISATEE
jgi:thiol-disulfide isomerase/thioredoxin